MFVHGTPTWSFLWRNQIKALSNHYSCIAVDHLGFGLSAKPLHFSYSLQEHSQNLARLVNHLQLTEVTLVVHDFGGPIGLGWAVQNPEKVARIIILNSWMWPLTQEKRMMQASRFFGSAIGKFIYQQFKFSPQVLLPQAFYQKKKLTKKLHQQYLLPFQKKQDLLGTWHFAKALRQESPFFEEINRQKVFLKEKPALVLWGTEDQLIPASFLEKWQEAFPQAEIKTIKAGHFLQEEAPEEVTGKISEFLKGTTL